jgi:transcriptional regulator GlxA family with amidase domain
VVVQARRPSDAIVMVVQGGRLGGLVGLAVTSVFGLLTLATQGHDRTVLLGLSLISFAALTARLLLLERSSRQLVHELAASQGALIASEERMRAIVDGARVAMSENPDRSQVDLARELSVSPHHLSRVFRSLTGETITAYRARLRVRAALERMRGGELDLARLAADTGFADQSHLCRQVRLQTGQTPSALRDALVPLGI